VAGSAAGSVAEDAQAVVITGLFGTGKSSVAVEIADILEERGLPYAAIDLDWLCWGYAGDEPGAEHRMLLANLAPVVRNYLGTGVRFFVLARSLRSREELDGLRDAFPIPLRSVELTVTFEAIERRLVADVTAGRVDDLRDAAAWAAAGEGTGFAEFEVVNEGRLCDVADGIVRSLGWTEP
jgi:hypothetical protein